MAPPRRSKRLKSAQNSQILSMNQSAKAPVENVAVNTKGLAILPDELLLEIISYYPVTPIPDAYYPDVENQNIRRQVLFALSQTSVNLRRFFLCYLWQRIEVCINQYETMKKRTLALELVRQLEIVTIRDPTLAEYVQIVNVDISTYSQTSVLNELARCLALFPNMHTVQLSIADTSPPQGNMRSPLYPNPFTEYIYLSVQKVVVSSNFLCFLQCCPRARCVDLYDHSFSLRFWEVAAASCPLLEIAPSNGQIPISLLEGISKKFPGLRDLTLLQSHFFTDTGGWLPPHKRRVDESVISSLLAIKRLQKLTITEASEDSPCHKSARKLLLDLQRIDKQDKVLVLKFPKHRKKTIVLQYRKPSPTFI